MMKVAAIFVLLVAAAQASRDLQQDGQAAKAFLSQTCLRTQFPPKIGCDFECPENSCSVPGRSCVNDLSDCACRASEGFMMNNAGKCVCLRQQFPTRPGCDFKCPPNSCIRPGRSCVNDIADCMCNVHSGYVMDEATNECVKSSDYAADLAAAAEAPVLTCPKGENMALDPETQLCVKTLERRPTEGCSEDIDLDLVIVDGEKRCINEGETAPVPMCEAGYEVVDDEEKGVTCEKKIYTDPEMSCPSGFAKETTEDGKETCIANANQDPIMLCDRGFELDASGKNCVRTEQEEAEASCPQGKFMVAVENGVGCVTQWW